MILSFKDKETQALFDTGESKKLGSIARQALRKLYILNATNKLESLRIPSGNRLEALKGDRASQYSIRINERWRICFTWKDGNAYHVEIVDYH
ncbi:MAG: type II toxin-antitoxin system RelE/ParE family toxin [Desulfovibrionaceae bacterium]|nr:type II toxin-antitoxin system RelE/ParE family toxin [Desulfovibrionaceae bacterium]